MKLKDFINQRDGKKDSNLYSLTVDEDALFQEVLKAGFTNLSKKYHPDLKGDNEKIKLLNILKEKLKK